MALFAEGIVLERRGRKLIFLAFSLHPSRLRGESAVQHLPPRRKERKECANKNSFQAAKDLGLSSMGHLNGRSDE